ncbi:hypothetical protein [Spirochaeta lutea]|uniref:Outer membrane protein beta-barrel domain-containing protein n=1 Tax=Spirochaeta lutea TaxID=1480694 RepID=A0A098R3R8_9SPIO|nr:hypothetical protein [Spirochaeta lutea]KGE73342.1 hypothetical protein DC28_04235 [Spirochaeta lutea]
MKKRAVLMLLSILVLGAAGAESVSLRAATGAVLGTGDVFRGLGIELHGQYNVLGTGIHLGIWSNIHADFWTEQIAIPLGLTLGFGKNVYILAGTTLGSTPVFDLLKSPETVVTDILNTYGLGVHLPLLPLGDSMVFGSLNEIVFTLPRLNPDDQDTVNPFASLEAFAMGLKGYVMVSFEISH